MKIQYVVAASLLLSISAFAQKDELKALKKLDALETAPTPAQIQEYNTLFSAFESKIGSANEEQKRDFYYYRGTYYLVVELATNPANAVTAINKGMEDINKMFEIEKTTGKKKYTDELQQQTLPQIKGGILQMAQQFIDKKMYKEAGMAFGLAYKVDSKDPQTLYNAAAMAVNGQDYDKALEYYLELDKIKFTGEGTTFLATNKASGQDEGFPNKTTMDLSVKAGTHVNPREEKQPSVRPDIVKNIALIYNQKGESAKAKQFFANARKENPNDASLIVEEANLAYKSGNMEEYKKLIGEALAKNPNDANLVYNLGVLSMETAPVEAEKYFNKALEIKPDYFEALTNLGTLKLNGEKKIVEEMNKLGTSAKDNARYEALKKQRESLYTTALPYLEKAHKLKPDDQYVISVLASMYQALDRTAEYNAMKAKKKA
jgi:tetratricopeptide (TPR) repeat protein